MESNNYVKFKAFLLLLLFVFILIEIFGALDTLNTPYSGFILDNGHSVIKIYSNSPAERAGILEGDVIIKSGDINVDDIKALQRRGLPKIGEERQYLIQRDNQLINLTSVYSRLPLQKLILSFLGSLVGLIIIIYGIIPYLQKPTKNTTLFAFASMLLGFTFLDQPYFNTALIQTVLFIITKLFEFAGLAFLLHFFLSFPKIKSLIQKKFSLIAIYGIPFISSLYLILLNTLFINYSGTLAILTNIMYFGIIGLYILLSIILLIMTYIKLSHDDRIKYSYHIAFWGFVIGIFPIFIFYILQTFSSSDVLPYYQYASLFCVIIPITFSKSVIKVEVKSE